jgi:hypothetical protein
MPLGDNGGALLQVMAAMLHAFEHTFYVTLFLNDVKRPSGLQMVIISTER